MIKLQHSPISLLRVRVLSRLRFLVDAPIKERVRAGWIVAALGALGLIFNTQYGLFIDPSENRCMDEMVYLGIPHPGSIKRGDVVSFISNDQTMFGLMNGKRIGKIVVAMQGDHVISNANGVYINGKFVGKRNPISVRNIAAKGKQIVDMNRVLQRGELFVMGTRPRSFDSRYWGPLRDSTVDKFVKPLL